MASSTGGGDVDWQSERSLTECNNYMLDNQIECDVTFSLLPQAGGGEPVRMSAHRFVLISRSPVFFAMLNGPMAERDKAIKVTDIPPDTFKQFLRYLYSEELTLSPPTVFPLLYAAKKYLVRSLSKKCVRYLELIVSPENVCDLLENDFLFDDEPGLTKICHETIRRQSKAVFHSESLYQTTKHTLCKVLDVSPLSMREIDVFLAVHHWCERKCVYQDLLGTPENKRQILREVIAKVHFPSISLAEFTRIVVPTQVLTTEEENTLFRYLLEQNPRSRDQMSVPFPTASRECITQKSSFCYQGFVQHSTSYSALYQGVPQRSRWSVSLHIDQGIKLTEIAFLGKFKGTITIDQGGYRKLEVTCSSLEQTITFQDEAPTLDVGQFSIVSDSPFSYSGDYYSRSAGNSVPSVVCEQKNVCVFVKETSSLCFLAHLLLIPTDEMHFVENYYVDE